jgi:hypothetical protein
VKSVDVLLATFPRECCHLVLENGPVLFKGQFGQQGCPERFWDDDAVPVISLGRGEDWMGGEIPPPTFSAAVGEGKPQ